MFRRSFALFAALVGFFACATVCADPLVMTVENVVIYLDDKIDQQETARVRAETVGNKWTVEFFSKGDIVRLTLSGEKEAAVCERVQEGFLEDKYRCKHKTSDATLTLKTVGAYIRSGILQGTAWKKVGTFIAELIR